MLKYEGPIVPDLPFRRRLVPKELAIRCTRVWKALAYITQRVQDLGFLGRHHHLHYWGDDSFYLSDLWLQLSKRYSGQPAWLRASPKSTRNVASPGGDCDVLGACPGALRWAEVKQGGAVPWLTVLLWVTEMLSHWCWLRNNSLHITSAFD